ncbi:MAG: hypothetical protein GQ581_06955, partial [Methyloprofundus sp.]|nr:hypothetical protein [Methyloprofundus sp.]
MNRVPKQLSQNNKNGMSRWLLVIPVVIFITVGIILINDQDDVFENLEYINGQLLNRKLLAIADNQWVKIYPQDNGLQAFSFANLFGLSWHRQGHAGLAFDSNAKSLLTFGSNTHGE